jgi:fatty-acyl-CoA synthase
MQPNCSNRRNEHESMSDRVINCCADQHGQHDINLNSEDSKNSKDSKDTSPAKRLVNNRGDDVQETMYPEFSSRYPLLLTTLMKRPVQLYPNQIGVVYRNPISGDYLRFTWKQWYDRVSQLANALEKRLGVKPGKPGEPGDRVGTIALNTHRHLELYFGVPCIGATLHPINGRLSPEHIVYTIRHAQDKVIFVDDAMMPLLESIYDRINDVVEMFVYMSDRPGMPETRIRNMVSYEDLIAAEATQYDWPHLPEDTNATLCYTTGTTGQPKGAIFTHRQLYLMTLHMMAMPSLANIPHYDHGNATFLGENNVPLLNTPLYHIHGWGAPFVTVFSAHKIVLPGSFTVKGFCELVELEGVTSVSIVPTIAAMLLEYDAFDNYDLSSLARIDVGGGALPLGLKRKLEQKMPNFRISSGYGMTEAGPIVLRAVLKKSMVKCAKATVDEIMVKTGLPYPGLEVDVVDTDGKSVPRDGHTLGEIVFRGPWITEQYFRDPKQSAHAWRGGWFHSGDLARIDQDGYFMIADRLKDVIRSGAEMVPTLLLENIITMADFVLEAAVVGIPDPVWGEKPMALVTLRPGYQAEEEDVIACMHEHGINTGKITKWMLPKLVAFTHDIPKTSVGKFDKKSIRENLAPFLAMAKDVSHRAGK